jgi:WD40 repeat protein
MGEWTVTWPHNIFKAFDCTSGLRMPHPGLPTKLFSPTTCPSPWRLPQLSPSLRGRRMVATLTSHRDNIKKLVWGWRGAHLASCSTDRVAMVWSLDRGCEWKDLGEDMEGLHNSQLRGHQGEVTCAAFHSDGITLATSSLDCTVRFWLSGGQNIRGTLRHESQVTWVPSCRSVLLRGPERGRDGGRKGGRERCPSAKIYPQRRDSTTKLDKSSLP